MWGCLIPKGWGNGLIHECPQGQTNLERVPKKGCIGINLMKITSDLLDFDKWGSLHYLTKMCLIL